MAKTIVGELADLYVKFGGKADDLTGKETTAQMIDAIEQIYEDKGDTLPEVTADDNGKVLGVVNGEWDKTEVSNEFVVIYNFIGSSATANKTYAEIQNALTNGKTVRGILQTPSGSKTFLNLSYQDGSDLLAFSALVFASGNPAVYSITHFTNDTVSYKGAELTVTT